MTIIVIDLNRDLVASKHHMELALASAQWTERRARRLLELAKTTPAGLATAQDIYARASQRAQRLQDALDRVTRVGES